MYNNGKWHCCITKPTKKQFFKLLSVGSKYTGFNSFQMSFKFKNYQKFRNKENIES